MSYSFDGGGDYVPNQSQFTTDSSNSYYYEHASQTVQVKQDPDFHMFGSNGLLDMLATVATQTLNNDVSLRDVKTRPMSPQFEVKPNVSGNTSAILSSKTTSTRNPRSLTDYDVFTFQQVSKMSLNSLVRLFTETEFDEMRRIYRYRCALMNEDLCRETIQSFGNENKAKQCMKSHLQSHIKTLLQYDQYQNFTAEPVQARLRRLAAESGNTENFGHTQLSQHSNRVIKIENCHSVTEKENKNTVPKNQNRKRKFYGTGEVVEPSTCTTTAAATTSEGKPFLTEISNEPAMTLQVKRPKVEVVQQDLHVLDHVHQPEMTQLEVPVRHQMKREAIEDSISACSPSSPELEPVTTLLPQVKLEHQTRVQKDSFDYELYFQQQQQLQLQQQQLDIIDDHSYASVSTTTARSSQDLDSSLQNSLEDQENSQSDFDGLQQILDETSTDQQANPSIPENLANPILNQNSETDYPFVGTEVEIESHLDFSKAFRKKVVKPKQELTISTSTLKEVKVIESVQDVALAAIADLQKRGATTQDLICRICNPEKKFTAYTTLLSHFRSHAQIKPFVCPKCQAVFTRQHSLNYHLLIHDNSTRFTCTDCGRKFRHPSHFKEHQRRHTGESPFSCLQCDAKYKTRNTFKRHLKVQHGKLLSPSGSMADLTSEEFAKVQAAERKKEIVLLKSGRTVCPKTGKRTKIDGDSSTTTLTTPKKMSEDDFIVDYHYGDSVSNDDEVAKINAKLAEKQRRKMSGDNLVKTHATAASESSYYPSTNSEFSTPEVADKEEVKLPEFDTKPPPGVSGVAMTVKKISEQRHNTHATVTPQIKPQPIAVQRIAKKPTDSSNLSGASSRIVTTKPAFLAQINGQQVLLIPGPTPVNGPVPVTFQTLKKAPAGATVNFQTLKDNSPKTEGFKIVKKTASSTTITVQNYSSTCPPVEDKTKQTPPVTFHALKNPPKAPVKKRTTAKHSAKNPVSIQPVNSAPVTPGKAQSKLEQCLRYGSAAVAQQGSSGSKENTPAKNVPMKEVSSTIIRGPVVLKLPNSDAGDGHVNYVSQPTEQTPIKNEVTIELTAITEQIANNHIQANVYSENNSQNLSQEFILANEMEMSNQFELDQFSDYLVPEMVCEEEVVSCGREPEVDSCCTDPDIDSCYSEEVVSCESQTNEFVSPFSAEISVRIQSSSPPSNLMTRQQDPDKRQQQLYDPKWSPAVKHHRDRILCDLLGIK